MRLPRPAAALLGVLLLLALVLLLLPLPLPARRSALLARLRARTGGALFPLARALEWVEQRDADRMGSFVPVGVITGTGGDATADHVYPVLQRCDQAARAGTGCQTVGVWRGGQAYLPLPEIKSALDSDGVLPASLARGLPGNPGTLTFHAYAAPLRRFARSLV